LLENNSWSLVDPQIVAGDPFSYQTYIARSRAEFSVANTGYHPALSDDAISHLKALHRGRSEFLVIPSPALWWLDHYVGFGQYLADVGQEAFRDADLCVIFHLSRPLYN
jgi:hypothetical protein